MRAYARIAKTGGFFKVFIALFICCFIIPSFSEAAPVCSAIFTNDKIENLSYLLKTLDKQKISESGFKITVSRVGVEEPKIYLIDISRGKQEMIGELTVERVDHFYRWTKEKRLNDYQDLDGVIEADIPDKKRVYGRGLYVSKKLYDAMDFGEHLIVFSIEKPLILLQQDKMESRKKIAGAEVNFNLHALSVEQIYRIRKLGIAGVKALSYKETSGIDWYTIFNSDFLTLAKEKSVKDSKWDSTDMVYLVPNLTVFKNPMNLKYLDPDHLINRILQKRLTKVQKQVLKGDWNLKFYLDNTFPKTHPEALKIFKDAMK